MARLFNGSTDKIVTSQVSQLATGTIGGWFWLTSSLAATDEAQPFLFNESGNLNTFDKMIYMSGTNIGVYIFDGSPQVANYVHTPPTSAWFHVAGTFDGVTLTLYFNGVSHATQAAGNSFTGYTVPVNTFGQFGSTSRGPGDAQQIAWPGRMADMFTSSTVLAANEVAALAAGVRPFRVRPAGLQGYWPFDGLASPEPDLSGKKVNGTLTGTSQANGPLVAMFTSRRPISLPAAAVAATGLGALLSDQQGFIAGTGGLVLS